MQITAWMNMPSPYQSRFFAALASRPGVRVRVIYAYGISADRGAFGWKRVDEGAAYDVVMLPSPGWLHACRMAWQRRHDFQMVNSLWAVPVFIPVRLLHVFVGRGPLLVHSEASDPTVRRHPLKTLVRNAVGRLAGLTRRFGVLAIAPTAERQYRSLGFDPERVYPFGYFNESLSAASAAAPGRRLIFVGQLIPRKAWRQMLDALAPLWAEFPDLTLDVIGDGPDRDAMERQVRATPDARVSMVGAVDAARVPGHIAQRDLLVLPSTFDGWGLVVNEALMVGVPVVATSACGASCLIKDGMNGFIVEARDVEALRSALRRFLRLDADARLRMRADALRSARTISLETVAQYFVECFRHAAGQAEMKPAAPWL
jgi:glycosyltransferase involved in cell wall biosynthesis